MKKLRLLQKTLLVVALLCAGVNAWAQKTSVGTEDNTTGWWADFSDYYTIVPNRSLRLSLTNYTDKVENWHNWIAVVTTDADRGDEVNGYSEYLILRADHYGWGDSFNAGTLTSNYNWNTFKDDMDASHVEMTVTRSGATVTVRADITTSTGVQLFEQWVGTCGDGTQTIRFFLTAECAHLTDIAQNSAETNIYYFYQDYEDATDASSWTLPVGANNTLSLVEGDETHGNYIKHDTGDRSRNMYTVFSDTDFYEDNSYTAEFDCAFRAGNRTDKVELTVNPWGTNANTNTPYLFNMIEDNGITGNNNLPFNVNGAAEEVTFKAKTWYHVKLDVTSTTVGYTISDALGNALTNGIGSYTIPGGQSYKAKGITITTGRNYGESWMDNIKIYGVGTEKITTSVSSVSVNLATGSSVLAVSAETNAVTPSIKHYYSTSYLLTDPVEISDGSVELTSGTYYFYSVNTTSGSKSNSLQYVVDASEGITSPTVSISGSSVTVASGASNAGSSVTSYAVKYATSADPASDGITLTEGENTLDQGYYYIYTVSEYGNASEPVYAEVVCRNTETFDFKALYNNGNGYNTLNNSGSGKYGYDITTLTNSSGEVGRYINGRLQFWYQSGNGNNWWFRNNYGNNTLFVSSNKSSNFAVKVSADDAVIFYGSTLTFTDVANVYGVSNGDAVVSGKTYFAKADGYVVIKGGSYAQMEKVIVKTNDEIFSDISTSESVSGSTRVITVTPAYSTSDEQVNTYYTINGTNPTPSSALVEGNTITITDDCTVKIASVNTVTGHATPVFSKDVICGTVATTYDFSSAALTAAYGGTTISFDNTEASVATFNNIKYYQAYCGDGETKNVIENFAISKNGQLNYNADGLYNSGGGYRAFAILNAKAGQKIVFKTTAGNEPAEIRVISNASSMALGTGSGSWVFTVNSNGTVAFDTHRYSYINSITILNPVNVSVPISTYGYATLCPTYNLDFSAAEDIEACKASVDESGKITYTVVNTVATGEGVLLRSKAGGEATETIPVIASATANEDNAFVGITEKQLLAQTETVDETPYTRYILSVKNDVMGFYKVNTAGSWVSAGTAYLRVASSVVPANVRDFYPVWSDVPTDIHAIGNAKRTDGNYYNLQGQRIGQPARGLYIVDGKKVVIK